MKTSALLAVILAACQIEPPHKPLDPGDAKSLAEHAIYNTRTQKSYRTRFSAVIAAPQGDSLRYEGDTVWVFPGVIYIHYTATGGDEKNIVRAGETKGMPNVWAYHRLAGGWFTGDEMGMPGAARGIQNPDEVLSVLGRNPASAKLKEARVVEMAFKGEDIEKIMKEQAQQGAFDWKESSATIDLHVDEETRLRQFVCKANLVSTDPNVQGRVSYTATVDVVSYNTETRLDFQFENRPLPLDETIRKAIEEALKPGK
jgi:hypothetical protein